MNIKKLNLLKNRMVITAMMVAKSGSSAIVLAIFKIFNGACENKTRTKRFYRQETNLHSCMKLMYINKIVKNNIYLVH
jgi:hypothetical protein